MRPVFLFSASLIAVAASGCSLSQRAGDQRPPRAEAAKAGKPQGRAQIHFGKFPLADDPKTAFRPTHQELRQSQYILPRAYPNRTMDPKRRLAGYEKMKQMRPYRPRPGDGNAGPGKGPGGDRPTPGGAPGVTDMAGCAWVSRGPTNINGRITTIAIDPANRQRLYLSTVGGLWRSLDAGRRWQRVSDDFLSTLFASIAVNPGDGNEIIAGGGEPNYHNSSGENGLGIWRSTTGGGPGSWTKISPPELDNQVIYKLRYDTAPPNNVYAATSAGVYLGTRDAGGALSFARLGGFDAWTNDIAVDLSTTPRRVYAGVRAASASFGKGIWKYDGTSWTKRDSGIPTATGRTIAIALAASQPSTLYARLEQAATGLQQGIYKTTTGGETPAGGGDAWTLLPGGSALNDSLWPGGARGYSWYNSLLEVDPTDPDIVWGAGLSIYRSGDGGDSWQNVWQGTDPDYRHGTHADHHSVAFDPVNPKIVYLGNDGGLDRTTDTSSATWSWRDVGHNLIVTEFYRGAEQWAPASIRAGGSQDNGTEITFGNRTWHNPGGCDGADVAIDAENSSTLYANCNGGLYELVNPVPGTPGGGTNATMTLPAGLAPVAPVITDPQLAGRALMSAARGVADPPAPAPATWDPRRVVKTTDGLSWTSASDELPEQGIVSTMAIAPSSTFQTYYVGIADGVPWQGPNVVPAIWRTTTGGASWDTASTGLPPNLPPTGIAVDRADASRAFATFGGTGAVAVTSDGGATWTVLPGSGATALPSVPATGVAIDPANPAVIYVGTTIGVFRGEVSGIGTATPTAVWAPFNEGIPDGTDINAILANPDTGFLSIMTMGHGAYERDVNPGALCPVQFAHVRDNVFDRGYVPSPSDIPDPEYPIPDPARPPFYKPDDSAAGRLYWWTSPDIKVDVPAVDPPANLLAQVDHVEFDMCPPRISSCPPGIMIDSDPRRGGSARVHVQVTNRGVESASQVRVMALWADATTGLPLLPTDFWTASFPAPGGGACAAPAAGSPWQVADPANPCQTIPILRPDQPEVVSFDWNVPAGAAEHSCMLVIIESAGQPLDPSIRSANERQLWVLVPNSSQIALRNLHVVDSTTPGGTASGAEGMNVPNPTRNGGPIELTVSRQGMAPDGRVILVLPPQAREAVARQYGLKPAAPPRTREARRMMRRYKLDPSLSFEAAADTSFSLPVPPGENWTIGLVYDSGRARPNTASRFSLVARQGETVLGGSTYLLRVLPDERFARR